MYVRINWHKACLNLKLSSFESDHKSFPKELLKYSNQQPNHFEDLQLKLPIAPLAAEKCRLLQLG